MSIYSLRGLNVRFCRQAYILAHVRAGVAPMPGRTKLRLSLCECSNQQGNSSRGYAINTRAINDELTRLKPYLLAAITPLRSSHNNLYQMVKKRTLEARTKLQRNKFPNNQACEEEKTKKSTNVCNDQSGSTVCASPSPGLGATRPPINTYQSSSSSTSTSSSTTCKSQFDKVAKDPCPPRPDVSRKTTGSSKNAEMLQAKDCNISKRKKATCDKKPCDAEGGADGAGGKKGAPGGGSIMGDDEATRKTRMLLALLAALGLGGLLLWLLTRRKHKVTDSTECTTAPKIIPTVPATSAELPKHVPYLLIGGGTAAFSAFRAIKSNDPRAKVLMITNENRKPYMRPPLSKELWYSAEKGEITKDYRFKQWTGAERSLFFEPEEFFVEPAKLMETVNGGIAVAQGFTVKKLDAAKHIVTLADGYEITYDECLIATGCAPKNLDVFAQAAPGVKEKIMMYRSPDDFEKLKRYADEKKSITIVGNGFTGSELACSLANYAKDKKVKIYQIFPESGNMSKVLPNYLSKWTTAKVESMGVCVMSETSIKNAQRDEAVLKLVLNNGKSLLTDVVVVCVGCEPNTSIALTSGLETDRNLGGFVVNAELEARRNLFVAGDASCFYDPLLGRRRVEHHDHSVVSGRLAGENMVGKKKAYNHQSMFWSDLGPEVGYEGIGLVDASLRTVGVFALPTTSPERRTDNLTETAVMEGGGSGSTVTVNPETPDIKCDPNQADEYTRGVIFYMKDDKIVGILLWNLFNRIGLARTIINQNKKYDDLNEVAKLFEIHA
ncbi:putative apoptosis-inducing factor 1, mitochondrial isoform X1 [Zeugodacus cucurbitae]|uniref:putative apoptosis-inducing factor 1, mitochondrial isoform X1 n=1 Tax=Zeugodacus cucurbitae TaxID=28588 RepID=UPI0023D940A2|nr:putative apoptosis-inducing factor 1, mitochondrial isoform X1 [Zeugodacus cucurbitae]